CRLAAPFAGPGARGDGRDGATPPPLRGPRTPGGAGPNPAVWAGVAAQMKAHRRGNILVTADIGFGKRRQNSILLCHEMAGQSWRAKSGRLGRRWPAAAKQPR